MRPHDSADDVGEVEEAEVGGQMTKGLCKTHVEDGRESHVVFEDEHWDASGDDAAPRLDVGVQAS